MVPSYKTLGNSLRILVPERRLLHRNSHVELGNEGEIHTYCVKPLRVLKWFTIQICLLGLNQRALKNGKVIKAWKASRNCSIQSLEVCTEEAINNLPVSFIMNNCHLLVC